MDYDAVLEQAIALLQREQRLSYRVLKRRLQLDNEMLEDLKEDLIYAKQLAVDEEGKVLVWAGGAGAGETPAAPTREPARPPRSYTPPYLAEKILTSKTALKGERKQVTVLFADLKGSMELLADRDPEEARQLLDPVLERMMAAVHRYEGTVNQVMGDGIMALFGAPIAHEDHAVRACYAALAMQEAIARYAAELRQQQGLDVQIRVGLNSGEVVVRAIGSDLHMDYTAVGQTTHLAARMEQLARPGTTLLTSDTLRLVEGYVEVKPLGPVPVKGLPAPMEVCELVGAGPARTRPQALAARGLTPFVGRQAELAALHQTLEQAGTGHGQVVAVIGEPGVGKSRLLAEFLASPLTEAWRILETHAVSYGQATPYLPIRDLLKVYAQIDDRDDEHTIREKVGKCLTLDVALQPTRSSVLALLDVDVEDPEWQALDPSQRRLRTIAGVKRLLLRQSQVQPLLVSVENLHWIDAGTQAVLDSLVESLPTATLLLLVNYRPEYQHGWGSRTFYTQLRLDPLPPANAAELLQPLLGDGAALLPLTQLLFERTEGNPFFLEESVRTLVETQVLVGERGAYRLAKDVRTIQVPATVQAVLAARIDRLPPEEKRLLQTAAVIGHDVPFALLQAIAEAPEEVLRRGLAHLQGAEFLYETHLFPKLEYIFKHALTQEVAYGSLLQERRRALHARIVEVLEGRTADRGAEPVDQLAHHALLGEVWEKAVVYCRQAGEKAMARSAHREAVGYVEQALSALSQLPGTRDTREQAIDLRLALRHALYPLGELGRVLVVLQDTQALAETLGDQHRLGWVAVYLLAHFGQACELDQALTSGQRALAIAADLGDVGLTVTAQCYLATGYHSLGNYRQSVEFSRKNMENLHGALLQERFGLLGLAAVHSRLTLIHSLAECGDFIEGRVPAEEGVQIAEAADHPYSRVHAYWAVGFRALREGDLPQAIPALERALALAQEAYLRLLVPCVAAPLGAAYALAGRTSEAMPLLEQAVEQAAAMRFMLQHALRMVWLGETYVCAGRLKEADTQAQRALEFSRAHQERGHEAYALRLLGEIATHRDPPQVEEAKAHYQQALALAEALGMRPLQAHCHLGLGTLYLKIGRGDEAHTELSTAIELYRAMDMTFWLPQAEAALAQVEEP